MDAIKLKMDAPQALASKRDYTDEEIMSLSAEQK